jgi:predicted small metal-binding protein
MMADPPATRWSLACRDVGFSCEWEMRARPLEEVRSQFREHAKCAHAIAEIGPELSAKIDAARRPS